jgi:tetratricopeptide (TPR) repeat protein
MSALGVDTRSDIYSLGVLLYELLTGSTPLSRKRVREAAYSEVLRMIREEEPPRPSMRLSDSGEALASISAQRHTEPAKLTKLLRGELDWIVMKTLEKDRNRRYETANDFAMDLQRYLADEPVLACPPSVGYRLWKFARRNKGPVLAASVIALMLVGGIIGTSWQALRATQAERLAKDNEQHAVSQKGKAQANFELARDAVDKYLNKVTNNPKLKEKDFFQLRKELLETAVPFYQKFVEERSDDPELESARGRAYHRLALVRGVMGETEAAQADYEEMRVIFSKLAADFPSVVAYRQDLAASHNNLGKLLRDLGKRGEAEAAFRAALKVQEQLAADVPSDPEYRQELAGSHNNLGVLLKELGKLEPAEAAHRAALKIQEQLAADFPSVLAYRQDLASSHDNLGILLADLGKHGEAEAAYGAGLKIQEQLAAEFSSVPAYRQELARSHNNLGALLKDLGKRGEAEAAYGAALKVQEQLAAEFPSVPEYRRDLATSHNNLGVLLADLGKQGEAEAAYGAGLKIQEQMAAEFPSVPEYRKDLARSHNNLGALLNDLGKRREAEAAYRAALNIREQLAADFPGVAVYVVELGNSYKNFGNLVREKGEPQAALDWFARAIGALEPVLQKEPRLVSARQTLRNAHWSRALALDKLGRHADALKDWDRALALDPVAADQPFFPRNRALSLARGGEHAKAVAEANALAELKDVDRGTLYDLACVCAVASAAVRDAKSPGADVVQLAEEYAARAVELLRQAVAKGYKEAAHMKKDKDLDALRDREDFKRLVAELETKQE